MKALNISIFILTFALALSAFILLNPINCDVLIKGTFHDIQVSCKDKADNLNNYYTLEGCSRLYYQCKEGEVAEIGYTNGIKVFSENKCLDPAQFRCTYPIEPVPQLIQIKLTQSPLVESILSCKHKVDDKVYNIGKCTKFIFTCVEQKLSVIRICLNGTVLYDDPITGLSCQKIATCHRYDYQNKANKLYYYTTTSVATTTIDPKKSYLLTQTEIELETTTQYYVTTPTKTMPTQSSTTTKLYYYATTLVPTTTVLKTSYLPTQTKIELETTTQYYANTTTQSNRYIQDEFSPNIEEYPEHENPPDYDNKHYNGQNYNKLADHNEYPDIQEYDSHFPYQQPYPFYPQNPYEPNYFNQPYPNNHDHPYPNNYNSPYPNNYNPPYPYNYNPNENIYDQPDINRPFYGDQAYFDGDNDEDDDDDDDDEDNRTKKRLIDFNKFNRLADDFMKVFKNKINY